MSTTNTSTAYHAIEPCQPSIRPNRIELRDEQKKAVKDAKQRFANWEPGKCSKFLWNAKMRFGKTVSALQLAKEMGQQKEHPVKRTIIVTHRPDVQSNWEEDFKKIFTEEERANIDFATKFDGDNNDISALLANTGRGLVFFASMQYLRGSKLVGGKKSSPTKDAILTADWDLVVVDEAHEGTLTDLGSGVIDKLTDGGKRRLLSLSGTPFNLYENFAANEIFTWDYVMEQEKKLEWAQKPENKDKPEAENPYRTLPKMEIRILEPKNVMAWEEGFDLREFFRVDDGKEARAKLSKELAAWRSLPENQRGPKPVFPFVHEAKVYNFLSQLADDRDPANSYPFANVESRAQLRHTFWVLPGVKECQAMKNLLEKHPYYREKDEQGNPIPNHFRVINVAGTKEGDEESAKALDAVKNAIEALDGTGTGTITLSCGRLTTGVTIPQWTAVLYLKGSTSTKAATYMQTIFRVQSPWEFEDTADLETKMKKTCYVFDFDPTRCLSLIAETAKYSAKGRKESISERAQTVDEATRNSLKRFLELCQVCDMSGNMIQRDTDSLVRRLVEHLHKVAIEKAVTSGFDNQSIYNFDNLLQASVEEMEKIREVVGETNPDAKKQKNKPGPTYDDLATVRRNGGKPGETDGNRGRKELTPEQEAAREAADRLKKEKEKRVAILRGIAIRIPLMMFGAEGNSESTITLGNITNPKVVDDRSWNEFMPKGVTRELFKELKHYFDPEVFDGAGRRYRELTREADSLPPTERVARIAEIQSWFRNPNSETVLTPWKVVNRHLSDTIGGYCFFNEQFTGPNYIEVEPEPGSGKLLDYKETNEPRWVNQGDVTERVFRVADDDNSTLLEINSKSGLYPLYLVYTLYRKRLERYVEAQVIDSEIGLSLEEQQVIWDDAVAMCVHIICNTPMAEYITRRTLLGFRQCENEKDKAAFEASHPGQAGFIRRNLKIRNIDLVEQAKDKSKRPELVEQLRNPKFWNPISKTKEQMTFDAVVSNPPYQIMNEGNGNGSNPIYHEFIDLSSEISNFSSLIHPGRFLFRAGKTPKEWNDKMLNNKHLRVVDFWMKSQDVFPNVDIKGGVAITIIDNNTETDPIVFFSEHEEIRNILKKVKTKTKQTFDSIVGPRELYCLTEQLYIDHPEFEGRQSKGHRLSLGANIFDIFPEVFAEEKSDGKIGVYGRKNNQRRYMWINSEYINNPENLRTYKVIIPKANGSGAIGEVLSTPVIGVPVIGHTDTFLSIGKFADAEEASACLKYVKSKFARCLLGTLKVTQDNPKDVWANVPLQDFTSESKIPWDKSVSDIDKYLYEKYGLSQEEIDFIESMIKPME